MTWPLAVVFFELFAASGAILPSPPGQRSAQAIIESEVMDQAREDLSETEKRIANALLRAAFTTDEARLEAMDSIIKILGSIPKWELVSLVGRWSSQLNRPEVFIERPSDQNLLQYFFKGQAKILLHSILISLDPGDHQMIAEVIRLMRTLSQAQWSNDRRRIEIFLVGEEVARELSGRIQGIKNVGLRREVEKWREDLFPEKVGSALVRTLLKRREQFESLLRLETVLPDVAAEGEAVSDVFSSISSLQSLGQSQEELQSLALRLQEQGIELATEIQFELDLFPSLNEPLRDSEFSNAEIAVDQSLDRVTSFVDHLYESIQGRSPELIFAAQGQLQSAVNNNPFLNAVVELLSNERIPPFIRHELEKNLREWVQTHRHSDKELEKIFDEFNAGYHRLPEVATFVQFHIRQAKSWVELNRAQIISDGLSFLRSSFDEVVSKQVLRNQIGRLQFLASRWQQIKPLLFLARGAVEFAQTDKMNEQQKRALLNGIDQVTSKMLPDARKVAASVAVFEKWSSRVNGFSRTGRRQLEIFRAVFADPFLELRPLITSHFTKKQEQLRAILLNTVAVNEPIQTFDEFWAFLERTEAQLLDESLSFVDRVVGFGRTLEVLDADGFDSLERVLAFPIGEQADKVLSKTLINLRQSYIKEGELRVSADLKLRIFYRFEESLREGIDQIDLVVKALSESEQIRASDKAFEVFIRLLLENYFKLLPIDQKKEMVRGYLGLSPHASEVDKLMVIINEAGPMLKKMLQTLARSPDAGQQFRAFAQRTEAQLKPVPFDIVDTLLRERIPRLYPSQYVQFDREGKSGSMAQTHRALMVLDRKAFLKWANQKKQSDGGFRATGRIRALGDRQLRKLIGQMTEKDFEILLDQRILLEVGTRFILPQSRSRLNTDIEILDQLTPLFESHPDLQGSVFQNFGSIKASLVQQIEEELDLVLTGQNQLEATANFNQEFVIDVERSEMKVRLRAPAIYHPQTLARGVQIMEWIQQAQEVPRFFRNFPKLYQSVILRIYGHLLKVSLFGSGFFHGDPHQGNFLVTRKNDVIDFVILDYGMAGHLSRKEQRQMFLLSLAIKEGDADKVVASVKSLLGITQNQSSFQKLELSGLTEQEFDVLIKEVYLASKNRATAKEEPFALDHLLTDLANRGFRIPYNLTKFSRFLNVGEQMVFETGTSLTNGEIIERVARSTLKSEFGMRMRQLFWGQNTSNVGVPLTNRELWGIVTASAKKSCLSLVRPKISSR